MKAKSIHLRKSPLPPGRLITALLLISIFIQIIIITYNHLSGYHILGSTSYFFFRLFRGTVLSLISSLCIAVTGLLLIQHLNQKLPWNKFVFSRLAIQLPFTVVLGALLAIAVTYTAHAINPYREDFRGVVITNILIFACTSLILNIILEAWIFFNESRRARYMAENLEKQLSQVKFEVLKSQINPHFLFNSLNVLSVLISRDSAKAQAFVEEFSMIYRYVLETIEKPLVTLREELGFVRSYMFLQQIRHGDDIRLKTSLPAEILEHRMPPLSLQLVLENALKHNSFGKENPLIIDLFYENNHLIVKNIMNAKLSGEHSTGLGQKNLSRRYEMTGKLLPAFYIENENYIVKLPLLDDEKNQDTHR